MDILEQKFIKPNPSGVQKTKLFEMMAANSDFIEVSEKRSNKTRSQIDDYWRSVATTLNELPGCCKTGYGWRRTWTFMKYNRRRKKQKSLLTNKNKPNIDETENLDEISPNSNEVPGSAEINKTIRQVRSKTPNNSDKTSCDTIDECIELVDGKEIIPHYVNSTECCRQLVRAVANSINANQTENEIISSLCKNAKDNNHHCRKKKIWSVLRTITITKLDYMFEFGDYAELVPPKLRMTILDWLLFDTVLVHLNVDVIGVTKQEKTYRERKILRDLFNLVVEFKVEELTGEELADAWSNVTLNYNENGRRCTPMLLQRRWYQLKLATRNRFLKYWMCYEGHRKNDTILWRYKPMSLHVDIAKWHKTLLVEPFMLWQDLIKNNRVILREQFERIALRRRMMAEERDTRTVNDSEITFASEPFQGNNVPLLTAPATTSLETDVKTLPIAESVTIKQELINLNENTSNNQNIEEENNKLLEENTVFAFNDENVTTSTNTAVKIVKEEPLIDEIDIEENAIVMPQEETVLPKITQVFGNINVKTETLSKVCLLSEQINATGSAESVPKAVTVLSEQQSSHDVSNDVDTKVHIVPPLNNPIGEILNNMELADDGANIPDNVIRLNNEDMKTVIGATEATVKLENQETTAKEHVTNDENLVKTNCTKDDKLHMVPIVYTVKLEDMGILPLHLLEHIDNNVIIDMIHFKSKPVLKKLKSKTAPKVPSNKRVKLSSALFKRPTFCKYTPDKLCNNPDFNVELLKLSMNFLRHSRNRDLIRMCKPLTIDVSNHFENKLIDGNMYLNIDNHDSLENEDGVEKSLDTDFNKIVDQKDNNPHDIIVHMIQPGVNSPDIGITLIKSHQAATQLRTHVPETITIPQHPSLPFKPVSLTDVVLDLNTQVQDLTNHTCRNLNKLHLTSFDANVHTFNSCISLDSVQKIFSLLEAFKNSPMMIDDESNKTNSSDKGDWACCFARQRLYEIETNEKINTIHKCLYPICKCCCRETLARVSSELIYAPPQVDNINDTFAKKPNVSSVNQMDKPSSDLLAVHEDHDEPHIPVNIISKQSTAPNTLPIAFTPTLPFTKGHANDTKDSNTFAVKKHDSSVKQGDKFSSHLPTVHENRVAPRIRINILPKQSTKKKKTMPVVSTPTLPIKKKNAHNTQESNLKSRDLTVNQEDKSTSVVAPSHKNNVAPNVTPKQSDAPFSEPIPAFPALLIEKVDTNSTKELINTNSVSKFTKQPEYANRKQPVAKDTKTNQNHIEYSTQGSTFLEELMRLNYPKPSSIHPSGFEISATKYPKSSISLQDSLNNVLGSNNILLTTAKLPPNLKAFLSFQCYVKKSLQLPKSIQLKLLPNGRVALHRHRDAIVSKDLVDKLTLLVDDFYQQTSKNEVITKNTTYFQSSFNTIPNITNNNNLIGNNAKSSSDPPIDHRSNLDLVANSNEHCKTLQTDDNSSNNNTDTQATEIQIATADINVEKVALIKINNNSNPNIDAKDYLEESTLEIKIEPGVFTEANMNEENENKTSIRTEELSSSLAADKEPLQHTTPLYTSDVDTANTIPTSLGILNKMLTPITSMAQLKYAYSHNGLFCKIDLQTGQMVPLNICMKGKHKVRQAPCFDSTGPALDQSLVDLPDLPVVSETLTLNDILTRTVEHSLKRKYAMDDINIDITNSDAALQEKPMTVIKQKRMRRPKVKPITELTKKNTACDEEPTDIVIKQRKAPKSQVKLITEPTKESSVTDKEHKDIITKLRKVRKTKVKFIPGLANTNTASDKDIMITNVWSIGMSSDEPVNEKATEKTSSVEKCPSIDEPHNDTLGDLLNDEQQLKSNLPSELDSLDYELMNRINPNDISSVILFDDDARNERGTDITPSAELVGSQTEDTRYKNVNMKLVSLIDLAEDETPDNSYSNKEPTISLLDSSDGSLNKTLLSEIKEPERVFEPLKGKKIAYLEFKHDEPPDVIDLSDESVISVEDIE